MRKSLLVMCAAAALLLLAGCGGGGSGASLATDYVAVVGGKHIPKADFDALLAQAKRSFQQQGRKFPKQGTTDYETLKGHGFTQDDAWDIAAIAAFFALSNRIANASSMRPNDEFYLMGRVPKV